MPASDPPPPWLRGGGSRFATTRWSVVAAAGNSPSPQSQQALEQLCASCWYPLYVFTRRRGHAAAEAQDLVQGFFAYLLEKGTLATADEARGRFRTFLLAVYQRFLSHERDRVRAKKRGGGRRVVSFDAADAEDRYRREPFHELTPERIYERRYALTLLDRVLDRLEADFAARGRGELFEQLKPTLTGGNAAAHAELAAGLGMSPGAVKVAVHRLRKQYRDVLREEIAQTVDGPEEIDDELNRLLEALRDDD
jgi:DNA-directed RNA polymerase specialized sigma24 family protein